MKIPSILRWVCGAGNVLGLLALAVVSFQPASAQSVDKNVILQNKADQQDIRQHTSAVATQIQALIDELAANGITGDDAKILQTTKAVLNNLSAKEMERVITSLQTASQNTGSQTGEKNVIAAYGGQKEIILQFGQILKDYEQRQEASELPARFQQLTDEQTDTMRTTQQIAQSAIGKNLSELSPIEQTTEQIVQADQDSLANEVALAGQQLDKAVAGSTGDEGRALQQAQRDFKTGKLQAALTQANDDLKAAQLLTALGEQKIARDELRTITKDLNPAATAVDALTDDNAAIAKVIQEEKDLLAQTNAAFFVKPAVTGLDQKQGVIVDDTQLLQGDVETMSPAAGDLVKDAIAPMQLSRASLGPWGTSFQKAAVTEQQAIDKLLEAQKQLEQQLADAEKAAEDADKDPIADLEKLQKQIQAAQQQQQQVTAQTTQAANASDSNALTQAQTAQAALQQQTANLQQAAQPVALDASQSLANAAADMNQAQQAASDPSTAANAQAAQQAAQAALAQAAQQVGQQIAQDQQQTATPDALDAAANDLQQAQDQVGNAEADSTPANDPGNAPANDPGNDPASMAAAAAALAAAAQDANAAAATPGLPDAANAAVQQAEQDIAGGEKDAGNKDAKGTAAAADAAQNELAQAQAAVAAAEAGMHPDAGEQPSQTPGIATMTPEPPGPDSRSLTGAKMITGGSTDKGQLHAAPGGGGKFLTVQQRDRGSIAQTQTENRPQEYATMIDQYMKNLSDQSSASTQ